MFLAVGTCTCKAAVQPAQAKLREKRAKEGREREKGGGVNKQALERPPSSILPSRHPTPHLCHMFVAAPEEPSDWWVQPSVMSVSFEDERRLLVLFL